MPVKLNLSINEETARRIKTFAEINETSVSKIAEEYFDRLTKSVTGPKKSFVAKYAGSITNPVKNMQKTRDEYLKSKHGL
jgi:hypothetical protein